MSTIPFLRSNILSLVTSAGACLFGSHTKGGRNTNNKTFSLELLGQIDFVAWGIFNEDIQIWYSVALLDESGRGVVEESGLSPHARDAGYDLAYSEHSR